MNYLSRVTLKPSLEAKRLFVAEQIRPNTNHNPQSNNGRHALSASTPYRVHQALWQLFDLPDGSERPFLYREYQRGGETFYYVLSKLKPKSEHPFFSVQSKAFTPKLYNGQRLAFELRANPVVTVKRDNGKSSRHDVMMMAKKDMLAQGFDDPYAIDEAMFDAGVNWITNPTRLAEWGVIIHPKLELSAYTQHKFRRTSEDLSQQREQSKDKDASKEEDKNKTDRVTVNKKSRLIQFSSLDYEGALEIQDAKLFYDKLLQGFGKQKAFGCGLMLIRPLR